MPLHPQVEQFLEMVRAAGAPPLYEMEPADARASSAAIIQMIGPGPEVASVRDVQIPVEGDEIGARVYEPADGRAAVLVYFHGGGWVLGDVESSDAMCRRLANAAGCTVVSVDYRLAPEHRYPTAADDAYAALCWVDRELPHPDGLIVGGDSAGGNLACVCALRARDRGGPAIAAQALMYPVTDHDLGRSSYEEHGNSGYLLGLREMEWFWDHYADAAQRSEPDASPLRAPSLEGLPPAIVLIAEYDPLRDEGLAYATRLEEAGVPVEVIRFDDMLHGFFSMVNVFERADAAVDVIGERVRAALDGARAAA